MTTLLDEPRERAAPAQRLRSEMAALRLSFRWWGIHKTLSPDQKAAAAETFGADSQALSAGKRLVDVRHPTWQAVSAVRSRAVQLWKGCSLPFPAAGLRLVRQDQIGTITTQLEGLASQLDEAVAALDAQYSALKRAARERLGRLYAAEDYPHALTGLFAMRWDWPSVEPPEYLRRLSPALYAQEAARVAARFDEAVRLTEQAFIAEFTELVAHLTERLAGREDGKPKIFRDSAVENLHTFFDRFRQLSVGSNDELEELVARAQATLRGVPPQGLRDSQGLRQEIATQLAVVQSTLEGLLVDRPRRAIVRAPR